MNPRFMAGPWITIDDMKIIADALSEKGWYDERYKYVEMFEKEFAEYHGRKYGLLTPNCTQALHLLLLSLGIKEGDEVILPESTWTGSSAPVTYCKATPVFCDVEEKNWCLNPESVKKRITKKTKAIIAVDLYGNMPNMNELKKISEEFNIPLVEDAAEALGSEYKGIKAGKFGIGSVFSFHVTKTITSGEGGILLIDDETVYKRAKFLRDHGRSDKNAYEILEATPKYMPHNVQGALLHAQFLRLKDIIDKKRWIFNKFKEKLSDIPDLYFNQDDDEVYNGVWATSLVFGKSHNANKEELMKKLEELKLPSRAFFYPLSSQPAYKHYNTGSEELNPVAYDLSNRGITLPSALLLKEEDIEEYCNAIRKILNK